MRSRTLALAGLAVGAVLALVAGSRGWWRATGTGVSVAFTGTETTGGLAQALALVALAGALLGLVLRARGRRVLGVLLGLAGVGVVVLGTTRPRPASGTVQSRVLQVSLADQFSLTGTAWPYFYAAAGVVVAAAAVTMTVTARRWPVRAGRFERAGRTGSARVATAVNLDDPAAVWRAMDAGLDPTSDPTTAPEEGGAAVLQPLEADPAKDARGSDPSGRAGVTERSSGVTMRPRAVARDDEPT